MKHERATEATRQQAALYALGLLTQHEAHCFELHLEECLTCRAEFAKLLLASAQIGLAIKEEAPPEGLRERLAARIDSPRRNKRLSGLPEKQESVKTIEPEKKPEPTKINAPISVYAPKPLAPPRSRKAAFVIQAIIYVLFAALGVYAFYYRQSVEKEKSELRVRIESSEDSLTDLRRQLELQRENADKLERFQEMFRTHSVRIARLNGQPSTNHTGAVLWDDLTDDITVIGAFDPAPAGKVYLLWFSTPSERIFVGPLPSDRNGRVLTVIKLNQNMNAATDVMAIVTLESENDSSARTTPTAPWIASGRVE